MAHHDILAKCDRALMQFIINSNAGTAADTFPGKWSQDKPIPCTICFSHSFTTDKDVPYSGVYMVESFIEIRSSGVDEQFDTVGSAAGRAINRNEATYDLFFQGDGSSGQTLGQLITAAAKTHRDPDMQEFTCIDCRVTGGNQGFNPRNPKVAGNAWEDCLHLELVACPSNVS